jgi:hypothetical protein
MPRRKYLPKPDAPAADQGVNKLTPIIHDPMQRRIADQLKSALLEFLLAAKTGSATPAQRAALGKAFAMAEQLPDDVYSAAVKSARIEAGYDDQPRVE